MISRQGNLPGKKRELAKKIAKVKGRPEEVTDGMEKKIYTERGGRRKRRSRLIHSGDRVVLGHCGWHSHHTDRRFGESITGLYGRRADPDVPAGKRPLRGAGYGRPLSAEHTLFVGSLTKKSKNGKDGRADFTPYNFPTRRLSCSMSCFGVDVALLNQGCDCRTTGFTSAAAFLWTTPLPAAKQAKRIIAQVGNQDAQNSGRTVLTFRRSIALSKQSMRSSTAAA